MKPEDLKAQASSAAKKVRFRCASSRYERFHSLPSAQVEEKAKEVTKPGEEGTMDKVKHVRDPLHPLLSWTHPRWSTSLSAPAPRRSRLTPIVPAQLATDAKESLEHAVHKVGEVCVGLLPWSVPCLLTLCAGAAHDLRGEEVGAHPPWSVCG